MNSWRSESDSGRRHQWGGGGVLIILSSVIPFCLISFVIVIICPIFVSFFGLV